MTVSGKPRLFSDHDGAVMLLGLFLALFLAGTLFVIVSVGDAVLYRRTMQDGADAGAFAASVIAAKGMNLHGVLNVTMAATAGVLLVIRSVEVLLEIVLAILNALLASVVLAPKAAPLIAVITPAEATVEQVGDGVEQFVRIAHDALDVAHHAVQYGYPVIAEARAIDAMALRGSFDPPIVAGFVLPVLGPVLPSGTPGLPVETKTIGVLCDRASNAIGGRIANVQSSVPQWLMRFLGGAVERALRLGKRRTCADDVVEPPRGVLSTRRDGSDVWLGHEEFQYRGFGIGETLGSGPWATGERGLRLASGGRGAGRSVVSVLRHAGRLSIAQSEFYHDADTSKSEWLWRRRWRARLRRFWIPRGRALAGLRTACASVRRRSGAFGHLSSACDELASLVGTALSAH